MKHKEELDLREILRTNKNLTFLVGAGCSTETPSCLAGGQKMMEAIVKFSCIDSEIENILKLVKNNSIRFEALIDIIQNNYDYDLNIIDYYDQCKNPNIQHFYFAEMIKKGNFVMTVNFDTLIEQALQLSRLKSEYLIPVITKDDFLKYYDPKDIFRKGKFPVYKVHGSVKNIITEEQTKNTIISTVGTLGKIQKGWGEFLIEPFKRWLFRNITKNRILVIIGYSGSDDFDIVPTLRKLKDIKKLLWINYVNTTSSEIKIQDLMRENTDSVKDNLDEILESIKEAGNIKQIYRIDVNTTQLISEIFNKKLDIPDSCVNDNLDAWLRNKFGEIEIYKKTYITHQIYVMVNDFSKVLNIAKKLLLTSWELMDSKMTITSFHSIGTCYYDLGILNRAKKYEEKALLLAKNNWDNKITKAMIYNGLGIIQRRMHNYDEAIINFKLGLNICEEVGNDSDKAIYLNHIVDCLILLKNLTEAMKKLKRAKRLDKKSGSLRGKGYRLNNMARIHWINKNFSKAIDLLMKSLHIAKGLKDKRNIVERTINIGNVYSEQNNLYMAVKYYLKSLNLIDQIHYPDGEYEVQNNLGIFYGKKLGDPLYSLFSLEEAFAILKKLKRSRSPDAVLIKSDIIRLREILQNIGFNLVVLDDFSLILKPFGIYYFRRDF